MLYPQSPVSNPFHPTTRPTTVSKSMDNFLSAISWLMLLATSVGRISISVLQASFRIKLSWKKILNNFNMLSELMYGHIWVWPTPNMGPKIPEKNKITLYLLLQSILLQTSSISQTQVETLKQHNRGSLFLNSLTERILFC